MTFDKAELAKKTAVELSKIATDLGLDLSPEGSSKAEYVTAILAIQEEDAALDEPVVVEGEAVVEAEIPEDSKQKKFKLIVHNQEGVDATPFVKVQVNGTMYTIPREQEVVVPEEVIDVLNNAIITRLVLEGRDWVERAARRFPFTVLGRAK